MPLLEGKNLEKTYPDGTFALRGVSLNIEKGEMVAIMGPSGSGKSTLLHILGLLDDHTKGTYLFSGEKIRNFKEDNLAKMRNEKMGFVFQTFNLLARTSALDNVKLPLLYSNIPEKTWNNKAKEALAAVGLSHRESFEPAKMSGGERQRVAIARSLITDPEIIFADEPTGNLDSKSGKAIMKILQDLHKGGHTVVIITHEQEIADYAERIIFIRDGKIDFDKKVKQQEVIEENNDT